MSRRHPEENPKDPAKRASRFFTPFRMTVALAILYTLYFGILSIQRYKTLYASYYDLGIMHQTVYNTFRAIQTFDFSRILEMTNTTGPEQIYRMAIHNDILLAFLAPFYFINSTPKMLLVIQTVVLALGAVVVFKLTKQVFHDRKWKEKAALVFAFSWLLYFPMQRANLFDFHAVVLSSTMLLAMYYFWLTRRFRVSLLLFLLSIISKEQVALTTFMFGLYVLFHDVKPELFRHPVKRYREILKKIKKDGPNYRFGLVVIVTSIVWFILSVFVIIPFFHGGHHFATVRYGDLGDSPAKILLTVFTNPVSVVSELSRHDILSYLFLVLGPLGFLSLLSPIHLLIVLPEFAINLLSNDGGMRNLFFHYAAVIQPFVFISAIYGFGTVLRFVRSFAHAHDDKAVKYVLGYLLVVTLGFSYFKSPLIYSKEKEIHPFRYPQKEAMYVRPWEKILKDENIRVSATGQIAPHFAGRRYLYTFSKHYPAADYVIVRPSEVYNNWEQGAHIPAYKQLVRDTRFKLIEKKDNFEIYKKVSP